MVPSTMMAVVAYANGELIVGFAFGTPVSIWVRFAMVDLGNILHVRPYFFSATQPRPTRSVKLGIDWRVLDLPGLKININPISPFGVNALMG
jgi:hypothetical protein